MTAWTDAQMNVEMFLWLSEDIGCACIAGCFLFDSFNKHSEMYAIVSSASAAVGHYRLNMLNGRDNSIGYCNDAIAQVATGVV